MSRSAAPNPSPEPVAGSAEPTPAPAKAERWPSRDAFEDPNALGSWLYRAIIRWGGLMVRGYYRVEMRGEAFPKDAPVLLVQNHTNGLADAHFLMVATRRPIRILVKYKLMTTPFIGWLLRRMDAVPMYRKKDGVDTRQNAASFEAIDAALRDRAVIALFPEGESLNAIKIRPLKSGVARMAISATRSSEEPLGLRIVPTGVTYEDRDRFRSRASAVMVPAIDVAPLIEEAQGDDRVAITSIMERIREALESVTLHAENEDEYAAAVALERILPTTDAPLGLRRKAAQTLLLADEGERAGERRDLVRQLGESLAAAGLSGDDVLGDPPRASAVWVPYAVCAPLGAVAAIVWGPPIALAMKISTYARTPDKKVTLRILFTFAIQLLWVPLLAVLVGLWLGTNAGLVALLVGAVSLASFTGTMDGLKAGTQAARRRALARTPADEEALRNAIRSIREAFDPTGRPAGTSEG